MTGGLVRLQDLPQTSEELEMSIHVRSRGNSVVISTTGMDRFFGFKATLEIPVNRIQSVEVVPRSIVPPTPGPYLRLAGFHIPGLITYGSYGTEPNREFWAVYRQSDVLVISIDSWSYGRIVLGTKDPYADAASIA